MVSLYGKVSEHKQFDILRSIENSARLSWVRKNKYILLSQGAVTSGEIVLRTFVARRSTNSHDKKGKDREVKTTIIVNKNFLFNYKPLNLVVGSLTHNVGKFNPDDNLGIFNVVDENNKELSFEDGEVLVETEPTSYEIRSIRPDKSSSRNSTNEKILGEAILKNEENGLQRVDSVISYEYTYSLSWGKGHGLLTGMPFKVFFSNNTQIDGQWAIPKKENKVEVASIERYVLRKLNHIIIGIFHIQH